jgi:hypothetical protein
MKRLALSLCAMLLAATSVAAQTCPGGNFFKNDTLPDVPGGALPVAIIQGLCEGEAVAQVFDLSGFGPQKINKVSVGFGHIFGTPGLSAVINLEVYDGISWNGNVPTLGPKVFDLENDAQTSMQVSTHGINELDTSIYNIIVGNGASPHYVVCFRMSFQTTGSCAGGHPANFFTDATGQSSCTTIDKTSLMDIQGSGWIDAKYATVLGFPLCPQFFNGNWVIRACTENNGGDGQFIDVGNNLTGFFAPSLLADGSLAANGTFTVTFAGMPVNDLGFMFFDLTSLFVPFKGGVMVPGTAFLISFPTPVFAFDTVEFSSIMPPGVPPNTDIFVQGWFLDAGGPKGASASQGWQMITP